MEDLQAVHDRWPVGSELVGCLLSGRVLRMEDVGYVNTTAKHVGEPQSQLLSRQKVSG